MELYGMNLLRQMRGLLVLKKGRNVTIKPGVHLEGNITIGDNVRLGKGVILKGNITVLVGISGECRMTGTVFVDKFGSVPEGALFLGRYHDMELPIIQAVGYERITGKRYPSIDKGPIYIGPDTWIGFRTCVMSGVNIGPGAVVGAQSVVTHNVEPYEFVAGCPARHVGWRFPEDIRKHLMEIQWWKWSEEKMKRNKEFFTKNLLKESVDWEKLKE